jgi:phenylacetate-CoA ligase
MKTLLAKNFDRLIKEVTYAYDKVGFYRKLLDAANLSPVDIVTPDDISKLPTTEKKDYRKNFPIGVVAKGISFNDSSLYRSQSSGTTGERLITLEHGMLLLDRAVKCANVNMPLLMAYLTPQKRTCRYAAPNCSDVECASPNSTMQDRLLSDGTLVLGVYHDLLTTSETLIDRAINEIIEYQPHLYYVDPTHFAFLLSECKKRDIRLPAAPVITTYTGMTAVARRQIEAAFDQPVVCELAAMSEIGWIAMTCPQGHTHLNDNSYLLEFLVGERYAEAGEIAELVITSLDNGVIPHMRYRTGDAYRVLSEPCSCANPSVVVVMEGRMSNFLVYDGQKVISPKAVDDAIGAPDWLQMYQLKQDRQGNLSLRYMANELYRAGNEQQLIDAIISLLFGRLGENNITVSTEQASYLSTERSGKFQCCSTDMPE